MTRFGKFSLAIAALPLALGACRPNRGTANPEDYFPLIQVALAGGETAAYIGRSEAIRAKNFAGCVSAEALASGFDGAGQVLGGQLKGQIVFPALEIDVAECLSLRPANSAQLEGPVVSSVKVAAFVAPEEPPPAEEPTTEPAAEEPVAAEEPTTEPAAEEPEESPVLEDPMAAGSSDAAVLIEAIAGVTLAAILHYATKLKTANCKKGTAALGAVHYVNGMIKPIADEVASPDGKLSIPAVTVDLSECG